MILQWHLWYTWERVIFSYRSRKSSDELLTADPTMLLATCHPVFLTCCLDSLVSWPELLHLIHLQYVTSSLTIAQTIRRDAKTSWMDATPNQKGRRGQSEWKLTISNDSATTLRTSWGAAWFQWVLGIINSNRILLLVGILENTIGLLSLWLF